MRTGKKWFLFRRPFCSRIPSICCLSVSSFKILFHAKEEKKKKEKQQSKRRLTVTVLSQKSSDVIDHMLFLLSFHACIISLLLYICVSSIYSCLLDDDTLHFKHVTESRPVEDV